MSGKTAFVTGATGFVGINLVSALRDAGWNVTALHRKTSNTRYLAPLGAALVVGDITDRASLERGMPENVDAVFHVAASLSLEGRGDAQQTRINVEGTRNVVEVALAKNAKRFIHTSSMAAYGLQDGDVDETTRSTALDTPINYFRTKRLAEEEVDRGIANGLDAVIVNPSNIVGPYDTQSWARMFKLVHTGTLPGVGPGSGSFCHVREVVGAQPPRTAAARASATSSVAPTRATSNLRR
jgi:nucleoside-diphosphate-sugar epimerase